MRKASRQRCVRAADKPRAKPTPSLSRFDRIAPTAPEPLGLLVIVKFLVLGGIATDAAADASNPPANGADDAPIQFRCEDADVYSNEHRLSCRQHVIVRRPDLLVCCERFEGFADAQWQWQRFRCVGDVRAKRGNEMAWSREADYDFQTQDLTLTGAPMLQQAGSLVVGEKIIANAGRSDARVLKPSGQVMQSPEPLPEVVPYATDAPLPDRCPLPPRP